MKIQYAWSEFLPQQSIQNWRSTCETPDVMIDYKLILKYTLSMVRSYMSSNGGKNKLCSFSSKDDIWHLRGVRSLPPLQTLGNHCH